MEKRKLQLGIGCLILVLFAVFFCLFLIQRNEKQTRALDMPKSRIEEIDWAVFREEEIKLTEKRTITKAGIYHLTGSIQDGSLIVNTEGLVKLILDGITIQSNNGPAILIENAKKVEIELVGENQVSDGALYLGLGNINACIYSKVDLIFSGSGTLNLKGNYEVGIRTKKDLKWNGGTLFIQSKDDGIDAEDSFEFVQGKVNIVTDKNGIKVENKKDNIRGFMLIRDGDFSIKSRLDGIQTSSTLWIEKGHFEIETTGNVKGVHDDKNTISAKGLKGENITIQEGTYQITTTDDSIYARDTLTIFNGEATLSSGDDAIHATNSLTIHDGNLSVMKSYEGLESDQIEILGGNISIVSEDDGINAAGETKTSPREIGKSKLIIKDGVIHVDASGDGIDVNGNIEIDGGIIVIEGPESNGNGALDYDGELMMNGGTLLAVGSSNMAEGISNSSKQRGFLALFDEMMQGELEIKEKDGKELYKVSLNKKYNSVVFSSQELKENDEIEVYINQELIATIPIKEISTVYGKRIPNRR